MSEHRTTEQDSNHRHLEKMTTTELLQNINREDHTIAGAVQHVIPDLIPLVDIISQKIRDGGRLFYIGAGTSGRLGILDASECPPTFGVPDGLVIGMIAGGDSAIRKAVEFAEDDMDGAWNDLKKYNISPQDVVIGIAASGTTPYVIGGLSDCKKHHITTACITCNKNAPIIQHAQYPIVCVVGPEFVTGSTRMKAGTAQKLILNMISTSVMIKLGRVRDNKMVDMQLANNKLVHRGTKMVQEALGVSKEDAHKLLKRHKSVRSAIDSYSRTH